MFFHDCSELFGESVSEHGLRAENGRSAVCREAFFCRCFVFAKHFFDCGKLARLILVKPGLAVAVEPFVRVGYALKGVPEQLGVCFRHHQKRLKSQQHFFFYGGEKLLVCLERFPKGKAVVLYLTDLAEQTVFERFLFQVAQTEEIRAKAVPGDEVVDAAELQCTVKAVFASVEQGVDAPVKVFSDL